ncbi:hypothetical protein B7H18_24410 [Pseudomonas putida]|nr:hypothetical protein B7H18_24410 [Pseudomonas putida]
MNPLPQVLRCPQVMRDTCGSGFTREPGRSPGHQTLIYQRPAASWSLCLPSTHRGPSSVFSFFQNGARVFR